MELYTVDVDINNLKDKRRHVKDRFDDAYLSKALKKQRKLRNRRTRNKLREDINDADKNVRIADYFQTDEDLLAMREPFHPVYIFYLIKIHYI